MEPLLSIEFSPDDPRLQVYLERKDLVKLTVHLNPRLATDDFSFVVLANGIVHQDPFEAVTNPFLQERWNLFIDLDKKELWTGFGQPPLPIKAEDPMKLLGLLLDCYPGDATPSQVRECLGKFEYSKNSFKKLVSRLRKIIGPDIILPDSRCLNPEKIIIIKEKPLWKPTTTSM